RLAAPLATHRSRRRVPGRSSRCRAARTRRRSGTGDLHAPSGTGGVVVTAPVDPRSRVSAVVTDVVTTILPGVRPEDVTGDKHLKDLGADSVDRVEIISMLIERLRLDEPMSSFSALPDLDAVVDLLTHRCRH